MADLSDLGSVILLCRGSKGIYKERSKEGQPGSFIGHAVGCCDAGGGGDVVVSKF